MTEKELLELVQILKDKTISRQIVWAKISEDFSDHTEEYGILFSKGYLTYKKWAPIDKFYISLGIFDLNQMRLDTGWMDDEFVNYHKLENLIDVIKKSLADEVLSELLGKDVEKKDIDSNKPDIDWNISILKQLN